MNANDNQQPLMVVVVGATAVGKTAFSVQLAKDLGTEVISADSRQMYTEMAIGTAKPTPEEMDGVPHYFVDDRSVEHPMSAGDFEREGMAAALKIFEHHPVAVVAGGSGLYVKALLEGFDDMPEVPEGLRETLNKRMETEGLTALQAELKRLDPVHYEVMDIQNPQRVIRALEICHGTGQPYSSFRKGEGAKRPWRSLVIGLDRDRDELYERINLRMDLMLEAGLLDEAKKLHPLKNLPPLQTVGYQEIFGHLEGDYDWEEAVRLLKRNSRRYAKRQLTWFRRQAETEWYHPSQYEAVMNRIQEVLKD